MEGLGRRFDQCEDRVPEIEHKVDAVDHIVSYTLKLKATRETDSVADKWLEKPLRNIDIQQIRR